MTINVRKLEKTASFIKKIGKVREVENHSITTRNFEITYYCDTKSWSIKNIQKLEKILTIRINYRVYVWCSNT